jgi:hypothetical protein
MRLGTERRIAITVNDEQVHFTLRQATNQEINQFLSARFSTKRGKFGDSSTPARCNFFDKLLTKVENLEDPSGDPVTAETKDKIPANWKASIILSLYENEEVEEVDVKN